MTSLLKTIQNNIPVPLKNAAANPHVKAAANYTANVALSAASGYLAGKTIQIIASHHLQQLLCVSCAVSDKLPVVFATAAAITTVAESVTPAFVKKINEWSAQGAEALGLKETYMCHIPSSSLALNALATQYGCSVAGHNVGLFEAFAYGSVLPRVSKGLVSAGTKTFLEKTAIAHQAVKESLAKKPNGFFSGIFK